MLVYLTTQDPVTTPDSYNDITFAHFFFFLTMIRTCHFKQGVNDRGRRKKEEEEEETEKNTKTTTRSKEKTTTTTTKNTHVSTA